MNSKPAKLPKSSHQADPSATYGTEEHSTRVTTTGTTQDIDLRVIPQAFLNDLRNVDKKLRQKGRRLDSEAILTLIGGINHKRRRSNNNNNNNDDDTVVPPVPAPVQVHDGAEESKGASSTNAPPANNTPEITPEFIDLGIAHINEFLDKWVGTIKEEPHYVKGITPSVSRRINTRRRVILATMEFVDICDAFVAKKVLPRFQKYKDEFAREHNMNEKFQYSMILKKYEWIKANIAVLESEPRRFPFEDLQLQALSTGFVSQWQTYLRKRDSKLSRERNMVIEEDERDLQEKANIIYKKVLGKFLQQNRQPPRRQLGRRNNNFNSNSLRKGRGGQPTRRNARFQINSGRRKSTKTRSSFRPSRNIRFSSPKKRFNQRRSTGQRRQTRR